jgi:phosphate-selective porin OprO/OprP
MRSRLAHSARQPLGYVQSWLLGLALAVPALCAAADAPPPADPASGTDSLQQLRQELEQERAHLKVLEDRLAADEAAQAAAQSAAQAAAQAASQAAAQLAAAGGTAVTANPNALVGNFGPQGYTLQSVDGANVIHFRGNVTVDGRYFSDSYTPATDDTWLVRRLRPTLEGTIDNNFDFRIMPDFAQGKALLQDGWADARIEPWLVLQFGKFKAPVGLERLQLEQFDRFIEASLVSDLLPYRDLGFKVGGSIGQGLLTYDAGVFDGAVDGGSTDGNTVPDEDSTGKFTWEGRLFAKPFLATDVAFLQGFGAGVAGTYVNDAGVATSTTTTSLLAAYKTTGQQSMFSYRADTDTGTAPNNATIAQGIERRIVPQFYYYFRSVSLLGEYVQETQQVQRRLTSSTLRDATLQNIAWQLQAAWFVTGENEGYDSATPRRDFDFGQGGTGAWELIARYHEIRFDTTAFEDGVNSFANPLTAPRAAYAVGSGVNWYMNRNFKVQLDYEVTHFAGGAALGNRPDERVLTSQFALIF